MEDFTPNPPPPVKKSSPRLLLVMTGLGLLTVSVLVISTLRLNTKSSRPYQPLPTTTQPLPNPTKNITIYPTITPVRTPLIAQQKTHTYTSYIGQYSIEIPSLHHFGGQPLGGEFLISPSGNAIFSENTYMVDQDISNLNLTNITNLTYNSYASTINIFPTDIQPVKKQMVTIDSRPAFRIDYSDSSILLFKSTAIEYPNVVTVFEFRQITSNPLVAPILSSLKFISPNTSSWKELSGPGFSTIKIPPHFKSDVDQQKKLTAITSPTGEQIKIFIFDTPSQIYDRIELAQQYPDLVPEYFNHPELTDKLAQYAALNGDPSKAIFAATHIVIDQAWPTSMKITDTSTKNVYLFTKFNDNTVVQYPLSLSKTVDEILTTLRD